MKKLSKSIFSFLIIACGVIAIFMLFLPAMAFPDSDTVFTGYEVVFGTEFANLGDIVTGQIVGNVLGVLAYVLPLMAGLIAVLFKKGALISVILFTAGAALLLLMPDYTKTTMTVFNLTTDIEVAWTLSFGLIIAVVSSVIGVFAALFQTVYIAEKA